MPKTYIVDGNSLLFRAYYSTAYTGNLMTTKSGLPINAIFAFHNLIKKIKAMVTDGDHLYVTFDTGKPTFRKKEFENYKAQRSPAPQELVAQMPIAREMLESMDICWKELEGYEGDDLAGSMARYASEKGDEVRLFTSDKDFLQLLDFSDHVTVEMLKKGLTETICYTKNNLKELFGLNPDQIVDFKGIAGDSSDNYKGIKGIGEKTAMKLLEEHGHLEEIIAYCKEHPENKTNQKIINGEQDALFFKKLANIYTELDMKEDYENSLYHHYQKSKLSSFYLKYSLSQFLKGIDRMPGIIDDTNHQISLFQMESGDISLTEEEEKDFEISFDEKEIVNVRSFSEIKEKVLAMSYDSLGDNENTSPLYGFYFAGSKKIYALALSDAKEDESFLSFLKEEDKDLAVYDLKGMLVLLDRFAFPALKGVGFDLLLATYLTNPDSGQKKEELFLSYGISLIPEKNIAAQVAFYTMGLRTRVEEELDKNEEKRLFLEVELPLSRILSGMEIEGFPMDKDTLSLIDKEYQGILSDLQKKIYDLAGKEFNINSPRQLEQVLFTDLGIERNKGEKGTGIDVLTAHQDESPIIPLIIKYRLYNKLVSGYTQALPTHVQKDGKIHAIYNQALTSTGRLSMSEPNLQNISIRNEEGKSIRKAFYYPDHEFYILSLDYSQVELRMLSHVANIEALKEIFREGKDIHRATASRVFSVPFEEVTDEMRRRAKAVNFGIVYGISSFGLSNQLGISGKEASLLISQFKSAFPGIDQFQKDCIEQARKNGYVKTILNRRRYLKDINSTNRALRAFSERAAVNTVIQGSAADLIKVAMIACDKALQGYKTKIILQIHDELLFKVPKDELKTVLPILEQAMDHALELSVPLQADGTAALDWYEAH